MIKTELVPSRFERGRVRDELHAMFVRQMAA